MTPDVRQIVSDYAAWPGWLHRLDDAVYLLQPQGSADRGLYLREVSTLAARALDRTGDPLLTDVSQRFCAELTRRTASRLSPAARAYVQGRASTPAALVWALRDHVMPESLASYARGALLTALRAR